MKPVKVRACIAVAEGERFAWRVDTKARGNLPREDLSEFHAGEFLLLPEALDLVCLLAQEGRRVAMVNVHILVDSPLGALRHALPEGYLLRVVDSETFNRLWSRLCSLASFPPSQASA